MPENIIPNEGSRFRRAYPELSTSGARRAPSTELLAQAVLPSRSVGLSDISVHDRLGINFDAANRLGVIVNRFFPIPLDKLDIDRLKPTPDMYPGIPTVASIIVHFFDRTFPIIPLSGAEIVATRKWIGRVSRVVGKVSPKWQERFDVFGERVVETIADDKAFASAEKILRPIARFGWIASPRESFGEELADIYTHVATPRIIEDEDWFSDSGEVTTEAKVTELLEEMQIARSGSDLGMINRETHPLFVTLMRESGFPSDNFDIGKAAVGGAELMKGVETFLLQQGFDDIPEAPSAVKPWGITKPETWFRLDSVKRAWAETYEVPLLQRVKRDLPVILTLVRELLSVSGPKLVMAVKELAEDVLILGQQGKTNAEIAVALFARKREGLPSETVPKLPS